MTMIRIVAAVIVDSQGRVLLVRKHGTAAFMQPGGKLGRNEVPVEALARALHEELGWYGSSVFTSLGHFAAMAANEPGCTVAAELFAVEGGAPHSPRAEIDEMIWLHPDDAETLTLAPLTRKHVLPIVRQLG
jgi:8-oxo-dGTP diphosphatase